VTPPAQATWSGHAGLAHTMPTSRQGRAQQAAHDPFSRLRPLFGLRTMPSGLSGWPLLHTRAASGGDRLRARASGDRLPAHGTALVERVNTPCSRATGVRRPSLPQGQGALRPLGLPATADTLLQTAGTRRRDALSAPDLLASSSGDRQKLGAREAVRDLPRPRPCGPEGSVVDAALTGDCDPREQARRRDLRRERMDDRPCLGLLRPWRTAGGRDTDGQGRHPVTGLPPGGMGSPVLAPRSLHHALARGCAAGGHPHGAGQAAWGRSADACVGAFPCTREAERCSRVWGTRLAPYGRELAPEHTRLRRCRRDQQDAQSRGDVLGLTVFGGPDRPGPERLQRRTARPRLQQARRTCTAWMQQARHQRRAERRHALQSQLRGYSHDEGVHGNASRLAECSDHVERIRDTWLHRRSQQHRYPWQGFKDVLKPCARARPRMTEPAHVRPGRT
jgi:hypothetical protein